VSKDSKVSRIQAISFFRDADKKALEHLESAADEVTVPAGHTLIEQGHNHNEGLIVESGTAEVIIDGEVVAEIPEGEIIGELALLARGPASATVRAKTDMRLLVIPFNRFDQIMNENPAMVKAIARDLAIRLRAMDARQG
jgi:CRP/FNR family transcriptional regulator, cyclic AMP receptor protein